MRWLIDNPQILLLIGGAIAYWLTQRRQQKQLKTELKQELDREPTEEEMAERTRRIQEEIRRKIAERMGQTPVPPVVRVEDVRPVAAAPAAPIAPPPLPPRTSVVVSATEASGAAELERVMEQQRLYATQLQKLESLSRTAPTANNRAAAVAYSAQGPAAVPERRGVGLQDDLRNRDALRRIIVLREILGAPKALQ